MLVNVDAGEGEVGCRKDRALLDHVDAVNLALGGHAGDPGWTQELATEAQMKGVCVHLHPGFPDRENFGREPFPMEWGELAASLTEQRALLPEVRVCKFHGALYHEATNDRRLAGKLVAWCHEEGIEALLVFPGGALEAAAEKAEIAVLREGFMDRAYRLEGQEEGGRLVLAERKVPGAVHGEVALCLAQARKIIEEGRVGLLGGGEATLDCETLCLHGDSATALELASRLRKEVLQ